MSQLVTHISEFLHADVLVSFGAGILLALGLRFNHSGLFIPGNGRQLGILVLWKRSRQRRLLVNIGVI